jgi:hypothetical protein
LWLSIIGYGLIAPTHCPSALKGKNSDRPARRCGAGLQRWTAHPPHYAPDQAVIIFGAPSGGAEMRVILQILAMIAAVVVAAVATYFIVTFLLQFF